MSGIGEPANSGPAAEEGGASALTDTTLNDFFSPEPTPAAPVAEGAPAQPAPGTVPTPAPAAPAAPAPVVPAAPQGTPLPSEDIAGLRDAITQLAQTARPPGEQPAAPPDPLTSIPDYPIKLPDQIVNALAADDPAVRGQALSAVISATMKTVHQQVYTQMRANLEAVQQAIPQMISQHVQNNQVREKVTTDFYGTFPAYDTPMLRPVVQLAFIEVVKANPELARGGWTPALRDKVGEFLRASVPVGAAAPVAPQPPKPPANPPALFGGGARPASAQLTGQEAEIAKMFE